MSSRSLTVWMSGKLVGVWTVSRSGVHRFRYEETWIRSPYCRPLSLSLPVTAKGNEIRGERVLNYFDNLLPDDPRIRQRLAHKFATKSNAPFDLLAAVGRDCAGAVLVLPASQSPSGWDRIEGVELADEDVERLLNNATSAPLGQHEPPEDADLRLAIAGAQEKTALLKIADRWYRPLGTTPTTHILKLPLGLVGNMRADLGESVENEWLCLEILRALGLETAEAGVARFGHQKALVVTRFDRSWIGSSPQPDISTPSSDWWIARLPQEDLCQATGIAGDRKYEADGGPSMNDALQILAGGDNPDVDRARFVLSQLAFWLLAAIDGHAKNFSIFHRAGGRYRMTPLYDVVSAWPIIGKGANELAYEKAKLAMAIRSRSAHYRLIEIQARHWQHLAQTSGVPALWDRMVQMVEAVDAALDDVEGRLPEEFPSHLRNTVINGMRRHASSFLKGVGL